MRISTRRTIDALQNGLPLHLLIGLLCAGLTILAGKYAEAAESSPKPVMNRSGDMVLIPAGPYSSGYSPERAYKSCLTKHKGKCSRKWFADEDPVKTLDISAFWLDRYEVTQKDFQRVMQENPSSVSGSKLPVHGVIWEEARNYCRKVGKRLPTEAEWEKAALGGKSTSFYWGEDIRSATANFCDRRCDKRWREDDVDDGHAHVAPIGSYPANAYGLYDMAGNVYEWVNDWYEADYYRHRPVNDPPGPRKGDRRVMRGGSWINYSVGIRPADRTDADPDDRFDFSGFRCARDAASGSAKK